MLKGVIFDLDGTILNRDKSLKLFLDDQFERYHEYLTQVQKDDFINYFLEYDAHGYVKKDEVYRHLFETLNIDYIGADELKDDFDIHYPKFAFSYEEAANVLDRLQNRGYKLGLITNGTEEHQTYIIDILGLENKFLSVLISEKVGIRKPDPEIFLRMCDSLSLTPEQCMFVGDHPVNDVRASKNVGMTSVFRDNGVFQLPPAEEMDYCIKDLNELFNILDKESI